MPSILSGFRHDGGGPLLVLDAIGGAAPARRVLPLRGARMSLRWGPERHCTGYFDLIHYLSAPCPDQATLQDDETACAACTRRTGFQPSFYNLPRAALSRQQRIYNERPHVVYLAAFGRGVAKVGISSEDRVPLRWRGQGARLAVWLARCESAYEARDIEANVSRKLALPEQVRSKRKRALLNEPLDVARTREFLGQLRAEAESALRLPSLNAPVCDLHPVYLGDHPLILPLVDLTEATPALVSGTFLGLVGDIVVATEDGRQYMRSLKPLLGRTMEVSETLRDNPVPPGGQQLGFGF